MGIERSRIFRNEFDRNGFLERLSELTRETGARCLAGALMDNHLHLLLKTGRVPVAQLIQQLLTGYAVSYNRRHRRHGHLFQNRYKSILCQEDPYLLELVRYIHLNPVRAGIVSTVEELDHFAYSGHSAIMGRCKNDWQDTEGVLRLFAESELRAAEKERRRVMARSLLCYWAARKLGVSQAELSRRLNISTAPITFSVARGERIASQAGVEL